MPGRIGSKSMAIKAQIGYHPNEFNWFTPILSSISCPVEFDRSNSTGHEILLKMGVNSLGWNPIRPGCKSMNFNPNWAVFHARSNLKFDRARNTAQNGRKSVEFIGMIPNSTREAYKCYPSEFTPILSSISCPVEFDRSNSTGQEILLNLGWNSWIYSQVDWAWNTLLKLGIISMDLLPNWAIFMPGRICMPAFT